MIARALDMPVTTVYDRLRQHTKQGVITRHTTLIDFAKLGYHSVALVTFSNSKNLTEYLTDHPNVNSLHLVAMGTELIAELVFPSAHKLQNFVEDVTARFDVQTKVYQVVKEIRRETFIPSGESREP
jgi:DNA-binding Lrp family transcriptional regulator